MVIFKKNIKMTFKIITKIPFTTKLQYFFPKYFKSTTKCIYEFSLMSNTCIEKMLERYLFFGFQDKGHHKYLFLR